ncbi:MAG: ribbon-helix-helix domain-containing protein [Candidatus Bathyarchaeia archaeon]
MPRTLRKGAVPRKNIRIPKPMMDQVEKIVEEHPELYNNRQQFVESAIREKIEMFVLGRPVE